MSLDATPVDPAGVSLTAGRLHLRPWEPADADAVRAACQDPEVQRWTTVPAPYGRTDAETYVGTHSPAQWRNGTGAPFAVLDATDGALLASVALMSIGDGLAEIGYWAAPAARGQGVVTEAVGVVCRWGFAARSLQRVTWLAEVGNAPSRRVAEKAGFTVEGTLRSYLPHRGRLVDAWIGALLAGDQPLR